MKPSELYCELYHMSMRWAFFYLSLAVQLPRQDRRAYYDKVNAHKKMARLARKRSIAYKAKGE